MPSFPVLPESGGFFIAKNLPAPRWSSKPNRPRELFFARTKLKDQHMKTIRSLAIASLFVLSGATVNASTLVERFAADPALAGWQMFGNTNLFQWDSTNHVLAVTWDSTNQNSYFYHPLGVTLTTNDSFCVQFDLQLSDVTVFNYGNQLAIGLLHLADATNASFSRPNGSAANLFEFDYFGAFDEGANHYPASINATLKDTQPGYAGFDVIYDSITIQPGVTYRIQLIHRAGEATITGSVATNGVVISRLPLGYGSGPLGQFQLDTLAIDCYADDGYGDSILAHGTVAQLACASPLPVEQIKTLAADSVQFTSDTNWLYTLEQSADFQTWTPAAPAIFGSGTNLILQATNPPSAKAFYRVRAELP
jgi:hypothetical protein